MKVQNYKSIYGFLFFVFLSSCGYSQVDSSKSPLKVKAERYKPRHLNSDSIILCVENISDFERGFVFEILSIGDDSESVEIFNSILYSAYFNNDTSFFKKVKQNKELSDKNKAGFISPDAQLVPYVVKANETIQLYFIISGSPINKPVKLKIRIIPDYVDGEPEYKIESSPFLVYFRPVY